MGFAPDHWHEISVRVYYEDTDFSGVVYHANYLRFAERGRSDCLRDLGIHHTELAALTPALVFVVTQMQMAFHSPARIDDLLRVRTRFIDARGARMHIEQNIYCGDTVLWSAQVGAACTDLNGRPRRLPPDLLASLSQHIEASAP